MSADRRRRAEEIRAELEDHIERRARMLMRTGLAPDAARAEARRRLGDRPRIEEDCMRTWKRHGWRVTVRQWLEQAVRDVVLACRGFRRRPTPAAGVVLTLAVAIGACTAAFSLIDALILRPLPIHDPQSLIYLAVRGPGDSGDGLSFNYPLFRELRDAARPHARLLALSDQSRRDAIFDDSERSEKVYGQWVSGDAFDVLGVRPALGRVLASHDDVNPGQHPVAVLSHDFWTRRFGGDPDVLGRWVTIRERRLEIIGVAEKDFTGVEPGIITDIWVPTMMWDDQAISDPGTRWFRIWGRVQRGAAPEQARMVLQTVLTTFQREQAAMRPAESRDRLEQFLHARVFLRSAATGPSELRDNFQHALWVLAGLTVLVLLVACANVASLMVARAATREREMALRASIGAGRGTLMRQVLIESGLLALASCALGAFLAIVTAPRIVSMMSTTRTVVRLDIRLDWRLLIFLVCVGGLVTCLFGLGPALRASAVSPGDALRSGAGRQTARVGVFRPMVAAQVAFGFVVLFVAGLCLTSFVKLLRTDLGFDRSHLVLADVAAETLPQDDGKGLVPWEHLLERLEQTPGVASASLSGWGLFEGTGRNKSVRIPGRPMDGYTPWYLPVSPGFLETMGIPLLGGRDFEWSDARPASPTAVIVNRRFAERYFPGESPLGKRFLRVDGGATLVPQDIIGVAGDAKYTSLREEAPPTVYQPYPPEDAAVVQLRTRLELGALRSTLPEQLARTHPAFRLTDVTLQSTLVENHRVRDRALALLSAFFSVVAIVLVVVGLYGVLSYDVVRRTKEIGIRLALGARPVRVIGFVLSEIGGMALVGLMMGAAGAMVTGRFMTALLFDVRPSEALRDRKSVV